MRRAKRFETTLMVLTLVSLCILSWGGGAAVWWVPQVVERELGPSNAELGLFQYVRLSWMLFPQRKEMKIGLDANAEPVKFRVETGETADSVALKLENGGLVKSGSDFRNYLVYTGLDTSLQAGEYQLSAAQSPVEIAKALQDATPEQVEFNILPGWRAEEIAAALPTSGLQISQQGFLQVVHSGRVANLPEGLGIEGDLEGYLMPGQYVFGRDARADDLVLAFVRKFDEAVTQELRGQFQANGLSVREGMILASIIQREAVLEDEQPLIASVFYNRLADGIRLESDPTVQYALGYNDEKQTWWTNPLSAADLKFDSPYNTYLYAGLPPGPIANPSLSALRAAAYSAQTPYYFFRAACDSSGRHEFARTYEEHVQNACP